MSIKKYTGSQTTASAENMANFLNANKAGTFLEGCTIEAPNLYGYGAVLSITDGVSRFSHNQKTDPGIDARTGFNNGTSSMEINTGGNTGYVYLTDAILCDNGLIISAHTGSTAYTGVIILTVDEDNHLACIFKGNNYNEVASSLRAMTRGVGSGSPTELSLTPTYGLNLTALIPMFVEGATQPIKLPAFYTSLQTQLPGLGLQAGSIESTDYITNGYCFIKDGE